MLKDEKKVAKVLNDYFTNLTKKLRLKSIIFNDPVILFEDINSIYKIKRILQRRSFIWRVSIF